MERPATSPENARKVARAGKEGKAALALYVTAAMASVTLPVNALKADSVVERDSVAGRGQAQEATASTVGSQAIGAVSSHFFWVFRQGMKANKMKATDYSEERLAEIQFSCVIMLSSPVTGGGGDF